MSSTHAYDCDLASRLETITEDDVEIARYQYDDNGNRTHVNGTLVATYDEQGRLLTYGDAAYRYLDLRAGFMTSIPDWCGLGRGIMGPKRGQFSHCNIWHDGLGLKHGQTVTY
ncbi:MAG: hypothetical protein KZQ97_22165 [Candidatus Thiodiazotropha sp. (ex Dulcina madagascariensis)]|nr:hypothetical protein [Candidatus Thiodiazotropha sp. (ex Dulcina madagascariensis)]